MTCTKNSRRQQQFNMADFAMDALNHLRAGQMRPAASNLELQEPACIW
jgi:hypothetical protein